MTKQRDGAVHDLKVDETLVLQFDEVAQPGQVAGRVSITLEAKSGQVARLRVIAPESVALCWPNKKPAHVG